MAGMVLVLDDILVFRRRYRLRDMASVEYLIQAVPARVHLQRIREEHHDDDRELPDGDEEGGRGVHRDDVRADVGAEGEVAEDGDDLVGEDSGADGGADDDVHAWLAVRGELVVEGEELNGSVRRGYVFQVRWYVRSARK